MSIWEKLTGKKSEKSTDNMHADIENEASKLMVKIRDLEQKIASGELDSNLQNNVARMKEKLQGLKDKQNFLMEKGGLAEENNNEQVAT